MEFSLYISDIKKLGYCTDEISRIYFGNEFCEKLIPTEEEISEVLSFAEKRNISFTLVTPFSTANAIAHLDKIFDKLCGRGKDGIEVVFNDWGVLQVLLSKGNGLKPVMGRLLNKMKRGPRLMGIINLIPQSLSNYYRSTNLDLPWLIKFLKENRVERVELDNLLQDINIKSISSELKASLYIPFAYISTTRLCLSAGSDGEESSESIDISSCRKECKNYTFFLENPVMPSRLIRKGNTIFFKNEKLPTDLNSGAIDRIVIEPEIPM